MPPDRLSTTLSALADPTRRAILARLARGEASVKELAEPFEMSLPAVSKHLKVLQRAGLISRGARRNGGHAGSKASRCATSRPGSRTTAAFGTRASIASTPISRSFSKETRMAAATDATGFPELTFTRVFDAPRELVFKVWTDPYHVAQWWGPHGFAIPVCNVDARQGGRFDVHMQGDDGIILPSVGEFFEVVPPSRIVFSSNLEDGDGNRLIEVVNTDHAGRGRRQDQDDAAHQGHRAPCPKSPTSSAAWRWAGPRACSASRPKSLVRRGAADARPQSRNLPSQE